MKNAWFFCVLFVATSWASAQAKVDRAQYLEGQVSGAIGMCHEYVVATAKDPSSLQFAEKASYSFGRALFRDSIYVTLDVMGRNTFGAVLRHEMTCRVVCQQGKSCSVAEMNDSGG